MHRRIGGGGGLQKLVPSLALIDMDGRTDGQLNNPAGRPDSQAGLLCERTR